MIRIDTLWLCAQPQDMRAGTDRLLNIVINTIGQARAHLQQQVQSQAREIAWRDAKLEKVHFELARLQRWKFGAKTEAMTAEQRALFQDTLAEDEASLQAQLAELQAGLPETPKAPKAPPRQPVKGRRILPTRGRSDFPTRLR